MSGIPKAVFLSKCTDANGNILRAGYLVKVKAHGHWGITDDKYALMQIRAMRQYKHTDNRIMIACSDISPSGVVGPGTYGGLLPSELEFLAKKLHNFDEFLTIAKLQNELCQRHFNREQ